jgi:DNA-binding MarR family transcriptional regulator
LEKEELLNELLVMLFNEVLDMEHKALINGSFKEISINDMHIINAIGIQEARNMSAVAKTMSVTVGTLTTAINNLVKKGYVSRIRSAEDKRVVLLSLTEKGVAAYQKHAVFHKQMVQTVMDGFEGEEMEVLLRAFKKLRGYFKTS